MSTLTWDQLLSLPEERVEFILDPYIPKEGIALLHGRKSLGKSPIAWNIGLSVASGRPWCGLPVKQATVLYVEVDTPQVTVTPRIKLLEPDYPREAPFHALFLGATNILNPSAKVRAKLAAAAELRPGLVILNTTRRIGVGLDFNAAETPSLVYSALQAAFPGSALLFIHHDRKVQKDSTPEMEREDLAGSLAWANDAQVVVHLVKHGKSPGLVRLDHTGSQASELHAPLVLTVGEDGSHVSLHGEEILRQVRSVLAGIPGGTPARERDRLVAEALACSERHARTLRLRAEG